jgi:hypothetical protein
MDFLEKIKYLQEIIKITSEYTRCLEENIRFRKFLIEYFGIIKTDEEKERFVLLLEEFGALEWEKYGVNEYGNKERIRD